MADWPQCKRSVIILFSCTYSLAFLNLLFFFCFFVFCPNYLSTISSKYTDGNQVDIVPVIFLFIVSIQLFTTNSCSSSSSMLLFFIQFYIAIKEYNSVDLFYIHDLKLRMDLPKTDCENLPTRSNIEFLESLRRQAENF